MSTRFLFAALSLAMLFAFAPEAIGRSKAAGSRGEFATDEQVRAVWAKHGL